MRTSVGMSIFLPTFRTGMAFHSMSCLMVLLPIPVYSAASSTVIASLLPFMQPREIRGRVHWQIFTKAYADDGVLSSRVTKGKFIEEANMKEPLQPLFFVCSKQDGELLTTQSLKYCNKVLQKEVCGLEHFHFHALRHTYASTLVNHGANLKDVQMLLGHSDIKITLNTYSHVDDESRRKAVDIFEKAVTG